MRLSHLMQRGILETSAGFLLNKFKVKSRRDILFFEDISAQYTKTCEKHGYARDIEWASHQWGALTVKGLLPPLDRLPFKVICLLLRAAWTNLCVLDELSVVNEDGTLRIETKGEAITRLIGRNKFMPGFYAGTFAGIIGTQLESVSVHQTKKSAAYEFKVTDMPVTTMTKPRDSYLKLNFSNRPSVNSLERALKKNLFQLRDDNRIYFRDRPMSIAENTIFHLFSMRPSLLNEVSDVAYRFFSDTVSKSTSQDERLFLLKSLLESTGWGSVKIVQREEKIIIEVLDPPYGLQLETDNWDFLARMILGYLWLSDVTFEILGIEGSYKKVRLVYGH